MVSVQKMIQVTDAVLDCIPIVSTVTNGCYLYYQTAHKVDLHNPVAPGFITSLKIHALSKCEISCRSAAIPVLGNLACLTLLVERFRANSEPFIYALYNPQSHFSQEIIHLSLGNKALDDKERAKQALETAACNASSETFQKILQQKDNWTPDALNGALRATRTTVHQVSSNCHAIFNYLTCHRVSFDFEQKRSFLPFIERCLEKKQTVLVERLLELLPSPLPVEYETLLLHPDIVHTDMRKDICDKIVLLQPEDLYRGIRDALNEGDLNRAALLGNKFGKQLSLEQKRRLLTALLPLVWPHISQQRIDLFAVWIEEWKTELAPESDDIYENVSGYITRFSGKRPSIPGMTGETFLEVSTLVTDPEKNPEQTFAVANRGFLDALKKTFPDLSTQE